jgi:hypothetical protein
MPTIFALTDLARIPASPGRDEALRPYLTGAPSHNQSFHNQRIAASLAFSPEFIDELARSGNESVLRGLALNPFVTREQILTLTPSLGAFSLAFLSSKALSDDDCFLLVSSCFSSLSSSVPRVVKFDSMDFTNRPKTVALLATGLTGIPLAALADALTPAEMPTFADALRPRLAGWNPPRMPGAKFATASSHLGYAAAKAGLWGVHVQKEGQDPFIAWLSDPSVAPPIPSTNQRFVSALSRVADFLPQQYLDSVLEFMRVDGPDPTRLYTSGPVFSLANALCLNPLLPVSVLAGILLSCQPARRVPSAALVKRFTANPADAAEFAFYAPRMTGFAGFYPLFDFEPVRTAVLLFGDEEACRALLRSGFCPISDALACPASWVVSDFEPRDDLRLFLSARLGPSKVRAFELFEHSPAVSFEESLVSYLEITAPARSASF